MEENYTQIKLNVGPVEEASVESASNNEEINTSPTQTMLDDPETIPIDMAENRQAAPLDDDIQLVSPDEDIFKRVAENVNSPKDKRNYTSEWHDADADSDEDFILDETFASNAQADRQFMETFGINSTGGIKTVSDKDIPVSEEEEVAVESNESYEYTERLQNKEIKNMYDFAVSGIGKRLVFSVIFTVLLFATENLSLFFDNLTGIFNMNEYPYIHLGLSTVLLIACGICAYEQVYHGIKSIFSGDFLPESVGVVALIVSFVHSVTSIVLVYLGYPCPRTFNFVSGAILIGTILFSFVNIVREEYGFRAISGKDSKFILEKVYQSNAEAEFDTFSTTSNGDFNGQIARTGKTEFVKNYFYNTNTNINTNKK